MPRLDLTNKQVRLLHEAVEEHLDERVKVGLSGDLRDLVFLEETLKALVKENDDSTGTETT